MAATVTAAHLEAIFELQDKMSAEIGKIERRVNKAAEAVEKADSRVVKFGKRAQSMGTKFKAAGASMTGAGRSMLGVTAAIVGGVTGAAVAFGRFESRMKTVQAFSGATADEMAELSEVAKRVGLDLGVGATQAAEGMTFLASAGLNTTQIIAAMPDVLNAAAAGEVEIARAGEIATDVMAGFGLKATDVGRISDVLTGTFTQTKTTMEVLGGAFTEVAKTASSYGQTLEGTSAALGTLGNSGIVAEKAGTALRNIIVNLAKPTGEAATLLKDMGIQVFDATGKMRPLNTILREIGEKSTNVATDALTIFGREAGNAAITLIEGADATAALGESLLDVEGKAAEVAKTMKDSLAGSMDRLKARAELLWNEIGDQLAPMLITLMDRLAELAAFITDEVVPKFASMSKPVKIFVIALGGLAAMAGPVLIAAGTIVGAVGSIATGLGALGIAMNATRLRAALMWGAITLGATAVVAAMWAWKGPATGILTAVGLAMIAVSVKAKIMWGAISGGITIVLGLMWGFRKQIGNVLSWVADKIAWFVERFFVLLGPLKGFLADKIRGIGEWADTWGEATEEAGDAMEDFAGDGQAQIEEMEDKLEELNETLEDTGDGAGDAGDKVKNLVVPAVIEMGEVIRRVGKKVAKEMKKQKDDIEDLEKAQREYQEVVEEMEKEVLPSVVGAWEDAQEAGLEAYSEVMEKAEDAGWTETQAASRAAAARIRAINNTLAKERERFIRTTTMARTLQYIQEHGSDGAARAASTAAEQAGEAWDTTMNAVREASAATSVQLGDDFQYVAGEGEEAAGTTEAALAAMYDRVRDRFDQLADRITDSFRDMGGAVGDYMSTFSAFVIDTLAGIGKEAGKSLFGAFSKVFEAANLAFPGVASLVGGIVGTLFDGVMSIFSGADAAAEKALEAARKEAERVKKVMDDVVDALSVGFKRAATEGKAAFEETFDSIYEGGVLTLEDLVKLDSEDAKSFLEAYKAATDAQSEAIERIMEEEKTRFLLAVGYEAELKRIKGESSQTAYEAMEEAEEAWKNTTAAMRQLTVETEADVEAITEAFVERQQEILDGLVNSAIPKVQSAFTAAAKAGTEAYGEAYDAAIEAGKGAEEAARLAAEAQIAASNMVLEQKKFEFQRTAAFEAALNAIRNENEQDAIAAAVRAANETGRAWDAAMKAVAEADAATTEAMSKSAEEQERISADVAATQEQAAVDSATAAQENMADVEEKASESFAGVEQSAADAFQGVADASATMADAVNEHLARIQDEIVIQVRYSTPDIPGAGGGASGVATVATAIGEATTGGTASIPAGPSGGHAPSGGYSGPKEVVLNLDGEEMGRVMLDRLREAQGAAGY